MIGKNFIQNFCLLGKDTEIPDTFCIWSALAGVSCVLGRRLWIDMGIFNIYPNIYVVLVAGSGVHRKSTAIGLIRRPLRDLEPKPNLIAEKITTEALFSSIHRVQIDIEGGVVKESCEGFVIVDELSVFLNRRSYESGLGSILIPLYDCLEKLTYTTITHGEKAASDTCLGLLGASTIDWIRDAIPSSAVGGGLTSRIIFVYHDEKTLPQARPGRGGKKLEVKEAVLQGLNRIQTIPAGEVGLTNAAWDLYEETYNDFFLNHPFNHSRALAGYASRRGNHVLKLSMLFAVAEAESTVIIQEQHVQQALTLLSSAEPHMPQVLALITATEKGAITQEIMARILSRKKITRKELQNAFAHRMSADELDGVIRTLVGSGKVEVSVSNRDTWYIAT